jgi:hypothetical protein
MVFLCAFSLILDQLNILSKLNNILSMKLSVTLTSQNRTGTTISEIGNKKNRFMKSRIAGYIFRRFLISASHCGLICRVRSPRDVVEASIFIENGLLPPYYSDTVLRGYMIRTEKSLHNVPYDLQSGYC